MAAEPTALVTVGISLLDREVGQFAFPLWDHKVEPAELERLYCGETTAKAADQYGRLRHRPYCPNCSVKMYTLTAARRGDFMGSASRST